MINFKAINAMGLIRPQSTSETKHYINNNLERSPNKDVVSFCGVKNDATTKTTKTRLPKAFQNKTTEEKLDYVKKSKILTDEVLYYLEPQIGTKNGQKIFTSTQVQIIDEALRKVELFKSLAKELAKDADENGQKVLSHMKNILGGDEGYGKHVIMRKKDAVSIYDKLVKEFKDNYIKTSFHDVFAQKLCKMPYMMLDKDEKELVKISIQDGDIKLDKSDYAKWLKSFTPDTKNYLAKTCYKKNYENCTKAEKNEIKKFIDSKPHITQKIEKDEAAGWIRDLVGIRLVLPQATRSDVTKVEKYLDKALAKNELNLTRISNYRSNSVLPYLKEETARRWKDTIPGVELVTKGIKKSNGYTTTQMNFEHYLEGKERPILVEFQIRSEEMNFTNNLEHYIYDVLQKKDITKGIPELKTYFESSGFIKAVNEVFGKEDSTQPTKEERYMDYEHAMFSYIRDAETPTYKFGKMHKPILADFGLGEYENTLSFDALKQMNEVVELIKSKYGEKTKSK